MYGPDGVKDCLFPSGKDYGTIANYWIDRLHKEFPEVKVALSGFDGTYYVQRKTWNADMISTARHFDAISIHLYVYPSGMFYDGTKDTTKLCQEQQAEYQNLSNPQGVADVFSSFVQKLSYYQNQGYPPNLPLWITESGSSDNPTYGFSGTWAEGLASSWWVMNWIQNPTIQIFEDFTNVSNSLYGEIWYKNKPGYAQRTLGGVTCTTHPATIPYDYSPKGWSLSLLGQALSGMTQYSSLSFSPNVTLSGKYAASFPGITGKIYSNGSQKKALILNWSSQPVSFDMQLSNLPFNYFSQFSANPQQLSSGEVSTTQDVNSIDYQEGFSQRGEVTIPAYSITLLDTRTLPIPTVTTPTPTQTITPIPTIISTTITPTPQITCSVGVACPRLVTAQGCSYVIKNCSCLLECTNPTPTTISTLMPTASPTNQPPSYLQLPAIIEQPNQTQLDSTLEQNTPLLEAESFMPSTNSTPTNQTTQPNVTSGELQPTQHIQQTQPKVAEPTQSSAVTHPQPTQAFSSQTNLENLPIEGSQGVIPVSSSQAKPIVYSVIYSLEHPLTAILQVNHAITSGVNNFILGFFTKKQ